MTHGPTGEGVELVEEDIVVVVVEVVVVDGVVEGVCVVLVVVDGVVEETVVACTVKQESDKCSKLLSTTALAGNKTW